MKRLSHMLVLMFALILCVSTMMVPAFASEGESLGGGTVEFTEEELAELGGGVTAEALESYANGCIGEMWFTSLLSTSSETGGSPVTIGGSVYYLRNGVTVEQVKRTIISRYNSEASLDKTLEITSDVGVTADTGAAMEALSGFVPYVNMILGIIVTLITLGLAVFTAFDVCYITFPVFRNKCEQQKMQGSGAFVRQTNNGGTKLRWVSEEAQYAVDHASLDQGSNPLMNYLKNRIIAYIFVAIILFILLTGNISIITDLALRAVQGIMSVLQGISA